MAFGSTQSKLKDAQSQIYQLRKQVESLAQDKVSPAVSDFASRAGSAMNSAGNVVKGQTQYVSDQVQEWPLTGLMIAAVAGFVIGRIMR